MHSVYDIYMDKCEFESESEVTQACPTLCDPVRCRLPGSSVHGIVQARILARDAIAFSVINHSLYIFKIIYNTPQSYSKKKV